VLFGCYLLALSRNPGASSLLFSNLILGFALIEAMALFSILMAFLLLFAA
jgi:F0F1-type ATP synthase membrane subunit c/vacuolar-type H+-ATPase subunit K